MMRQLYRRVTMAATLLLPALTGCVLQKSSPPPVPVIAIAPPPDQAPLYDTALAQTDGILPQLPPPPHIEVQPAPPPQSVIVDNSRKPRTRRGRKAEAEVASERDRENREKESAANSSAAPAPTETAPAAETQPVKVTASTPVGDTAQPTVIGQLTAGPTPETDASKRQASDLIDSTERGVNSLHRTLSDDQTKTVAQIRNFLIQAQRAMHNGDVDGAYTLATKAKLLLNELTGAS